MHICRRIRCFSSEGYKLCRIVYLPTLCAISLCNLQPILAFLLATRVLSHSSEMRARMRRKNGYLFFFRDSWSCIYLLSPYRSLVLKVTTERFFFSSRGSIIHCRRCRLLLRINRRYERLMVGFWPTVSAFFYEFVAHLAYGYIFCHIQIDWI